MTLDELRKHKLQIEAICAKYGVTNIRVFGSVARGDARPGSDVDLLADLSQSHGWDFISAKLEISDYLGRAVDVVDEQCMDPYIAASIRKEAVPL
ncbi:MAG: nucleotidyltransferase family protein [Alphaproteobacteria bacterium]